MITKTDRIRSSLPEHLGFANNVLSIYTYVKNMHGVASFFCTWSTCNTGVLLLLLVENTAFFSEVVYRLVVRKACAMNYFEVPSVTTAGPYRFQYPSLSITGLIM